MSDARCTCTTHPGGAVEVTGHCPVHAPESLAWDPSICTDCGTAPVWRHADSGHYCRRCADKSGQRTYVPIDPDKLDKLLGVETAAKVLAACRADWE